MELINTILTAFQSTSWLERFSVICGIIQVILSKNNRSSNYLFGIMGIVSGMYLLFEAKLYAEIALSMYYLVMSIYGWWYWNTKTDATAHIISYCTKQEYVTAAAISLVGFGILYLILSKYTDSDVPVWDAWVSSTAWAGMWLLAKRKIENWILLNISNLFAIPLQIHKNLYLVATLTAFLFIMAILGYFKWKQIINQQKNIQPAT